MGAAAPCSPDSRRPDDDAKSAESAVSNVAFDEGDAANIFRHDRKQRNASHRPNAMHLPRQQAMLDPTPAPTANPTAATQHHQTMKKKITIAALAIVTGLLSSAVSYAGETKWVPYIGAETGVDFVSNATTSYPGLDIGTVGFSFKPGAAFGIQSGFTYGKLLLGAELRYSQAKIDTLAWYAPDGTMEDELHAMDGQLRQLTLAPTIGYRLFSTGKFSATGQLTAGWLRRTFADVKHANFENGTASVLDDPQNTWMVKPSLVLGYTLGKHSTIELRYAYAFSGKASVTDRSRDEDDTDAHPDISGLKTHSLSLGYSYKF